MAQQYGDVGMIRLGSVSVVIISHPEVMAEAFEKHALSERHVNEALTLLSPAEGYVYSSYGENWRNLRDFARNRLWSPDDVALASKNHFEPTIDELSDRMCQIAESGQPVSANDVLFEGGYNMTFRTLFGWQENEAAEFRQWREMLGGRIAWFNYIASAPNPADFFHWMRILPRKLLRESRRQRDVRDGIIRELVNSVHRRRVSHLPATAGLVDVMLDKEEAGGICRPTIHALCMDVLGAVPAGVAASVSWFLLIVANRPEVQAKIHEELDRVIGRGAPPPTAEDHRHLPYTFACVAESMRYRTIAPIAIPHKASQDVELGGYRIPAGTQVWGSIYAVHHDARFWDSPNEFIPERFLPQADGSPAGTLTSPAYMPFGIGRRRCTGDHFALGAVWLHAARLLHRLRFETPAGSPLSEDETFGVAVLPRPYVLNVTRRR